MISQLNDSRLSAYLSSSNEGIDHISSLPLELIFKIFSCLTFQGLCSFSLVNHSYRHLLSIDTNDEKNHQKNHSILINIWKKAIYEEMAISDKNWALWFGEEAVKGETPGEDFKSLPVLKVIKVLREFKKVFPEKSARKSLLLVRMPKALNGELTFKNLGELVKQKFPGANGGYHYISDEVLVNFGKMSLAKSYWAMMTTDLVPESKGKTYSRQKDLVREFASKLQVEFGVPMGLEAATSTFAHYFSTHKALEGCNEKSYTVCQETLTNRAVVIGGLSEKGLRVYLEQEADKDVGTLAIARF